MPQLDTLYMFLVFVWTWFILHLMMQKIKPIMITKTPKIPPMSNQKSTPTQTLPWT